jgi:Peptidase family S41
MSEKIYACLLRLFPSSFREDYGDEALQLFRDRSRNERGFLPRLRLWVDLLWDLALTVPREYFHVQPEVASYSAHLRSDGEPSFFVLTAESPGTGALLFGGVLSLAALIAFSTLLNHGVKNVPLSALIRSTQGTAKERSSAFSPEQRTPAHAEEQTIASTQPPQAGIATNASRSNSTKASDSQAKALPPDSPHTAKQQSGQSLATASPSQGDAKLDAAERHRIIDGAIANLMQHYIYSDVALKTTDVLLAHEKNGDDDTVTVGGAFADLLTRQIRDVSHDMHLEVVYSQNPLPDRPLGPTPEGLARYRKALEQDNCTFKKVEILPHHIGYLKLNAFPDPCICRTTATAAMASLNHADAIIFDLRDNGGGFSGMVSLMAAYLFDHPEYMYDPRESPTQQSWTPSPVPGNRLADKPVYVLTSGSTISAAEQFCYDLKMLKRVTLVGETTRGSAHAGVFHRIDDHFGMGIPEARAINPFSKTDWEGIGVEPDVKVIAADALEKAEKLAEIRLQKK